MRKPKYITSIDKIPQLASSEREAARKVGEKFVFRSNDYYQGLINWDDPNDPIRKLVIPDASELHEWGELDASHEEIYTKVPGLEHKYTDTALLLCNDVCGAYCRFCFRKRLFTVLALCWDGSYRTWLRYETLYKLLAGLATPLVISVHTIVSWDFATSVIPGWHTTIFPPYFVAGAIFSGMSMVLTLMIVARKTMRLEDYITVGHIDKMCKLTLTVSLMVGLAYVTELFVAFYSGNPYEQFAFTNRMLGPMAWSYAIMAVCNVGISQLLWFRAVRTNVAFVFCISIMANVGMWFERFVIIVTSLHRDYLPSSWADYTPTSIEVATLIGSFGLFFSCFLLFCRFVPVIAISEVKGVLSVGRNTEPTARPLPTAPAAAPAKKEGVMV